MNPEHLKFEGRLVELQLEVKAIRLRMEGLLRSLRDVLDPTEDIERVETETVLDQAVQLRDLAIRLADIRAQEAKTRRALGE